MSGYPDKFIHLDDVVPVDTTPPTEPTDVRVAAHRGRSVVSWRASSDTWGVAGLPRAPQRGADRSVRGTSYRDGNPLAGQTATYSVVAYDAAGHTSSPGRVKVLPGTESADRAWLETSAGPALCGRVGTDRRMRLGCRVLVDGAGERSGCTRRTAWGNPSSRAFLTGTDGSASYCRQVGRSGPVVHGPRRGDPRLGRRSHVGQHAATGRRRHLGEHAQRAGPVRTDRVRTAPHRDLLGPDPDRVALGHHPRGVVGQRGRPRVRRNPAGRDRLLPLAPRRPWGPHRLAPTSTPFTLTWRPRPRLRPSCPPGAPAYPTWVGSSPVRQPAGRRAPTDAAPAACSAAPAGAPSPCPARPSPARPGPGLPDRPVRTRHLVPAGRPHRGLRRALDLRVPVGDRPVDAHGSFAAGRQPHLGLAGRGPRAVRPGRHRASAAARLPGAHQRGLAHQRLARRVVGQRGLPRLRTVRAPGSPSAAPCRRARTAPPSPAPR
jgi:hypothetical protein